VVHKKIRKEGQWKKKLEERRGVRVKKTNKDAFDWNKK